MISVTELFREIVGRVAQAYGGNVSYLFGDWSYISGELTKWGKSRSVSMERFPVICLYSPFQEDRTGTDRKAELDFIIMTDTDKDYTNEERERYSFEEVLRPVYSLFIDEIRKDKRIESSYRDVVPHTYTENYRYGRLGVLMDNGKPFGDFVDVIEIKNLKITIKKERCNGNRL